MRPMQRQATQRNATALPTFFAIGLCLLCVTARGDDDSKLHDYTDLFANHQRLSAVEPKTDPKTGFIVGGMNTTEAIRALKEINGIKIADLESSMRPGKLSKAGFLGDKERLLEIMAADNDWVVKAGLTHQEIARHLRVLSAVSRAESEPFVYRGTRFRAKLIQFDGFQESPFNDGTKASDDVGLENLDNGEWIRYSLLVPMMIERYGFYEGKGTSYRVDPKQVVKLLSFLEVGDEAKPASKAPASKETQCVSATAIIDGCELGGKIMQVGMEPVHERWAPLHAVIKIQNSSDKERKLSFFCQIISQNSKNPSDAFVFRGRTYEMTIAPRETVVREFPFIDPMASMPRGYMKDTVAIRIARKPFKRYGDHIAIEPGKKLEVGDDPVTIAVKAEQVSP